MFNDFQKQKGIKFDIIKLRQALRKVIERKGFNNAGDITHFGAIFLNQIPRDPKPKLHIPIITNPGLIIVIENTVKHLLADGSAWITNNTKYHNVFNGGEENIVLLVVCVLNYKFN
jgi:hypothetical protein|tara:strand:+ start:725 stop:1072 length:348 start_codon:yes stop_codon:yes gene_type:complete